MKKTGKDRVQLTLTLSEGLNEQLREEAAKQKIAISYLVEEAIAAYLPPRTKPDVA